MSSTTSTFSTRNDKSMIPTMPSPSPSSPSSSSSSSTSFSPSSSSSPSTFTSTSSTLMSNYLNPSIKNEDQVAQEISQQLLSILKSDQDIQYSIPSLEVLRKRSLSWYKIQENGLFKIVIQLKDKAQQKSSMIVNKMTEDLINQWHDLQQQHRSNSVLSPKPSPTSSPIQPNEPIKLAIQKEPPQKPKAISNTTSFFASLGSNTPTANTKPFSASKLVSSQQQQQSKQPFELNQVLQQIKTSSSTLTAELNRKRVFENNNNISNHSSMMKNNNIDNNSNNNSNSNYISSNVKSESFSSSSTTMIKKRRKGNFRVTFKPDHCLVEVREYEKQPEEWNTNLHHIPVAEARDLEFDEAQVMSQAFHHQSQTPPTPKYQHHSDSHLVVSHHYNQSYQQDQQIIDKYYPPKLIRLPDDVQLPTSQSNEALIQTQREKVTIAAIYSSLSHIPYTPQEPDEIPDENSDTPIIPLESTDLIMENQQQPMTTLLQQPFVYQSPPISQSTLNSSPPTLQQHSFISTSMNYSHLNQQSISPSLHSSTFLQTATNPTYIPQQHPTTFVNISNQQLQQQPYFNYSQPPPIQQSQQQPNLTNYQLSNLFNNPDVINKLKEALQSTTASPSTYHPPEPQQTGSIPLNDYDYQDNISRSSKKSRKQRSTIICKFYGKSKGCRSGNDCPFSHID